MAATYSYKIGAGWNLPDGSLTNVEDLLGYPPVTQPVDLYPVRRLTLDGKEHGGGRINHEWAFRESLPIDKLKIIEDTFFEGGTLMNSAVTISTRRHNRADYARYNAYAILPQPGEDYEYDRGEAKNLRWRFRDLTAL